MKTKDAYKLLLFRLCAFHHVSVLFVLLRAVAASSCEQNCYFCSFLLQLKHCPSLSKNSVFFRFSSACFVMLKGNKEPKLDHNRRSGQGWLTYCWLLNIPVVGAHQSQRYMTASSCFLFVCASLFFWEKSLKTLTTDPLNGDSQSHWRRKSCYAGSGFLWDWHFNQTLKSPLLILFILASNLTAWQGWWTFSCSGLWLLLCRRLSFLLGEFSKLVYYLCKVASGIIITIIVIYYGNCYCLHLFACILFTCVFAVSNSIPGIFPYNDNKYLVLFITRSFI